MAQYNINRSLFLILLDGPGKPSAERKLSYLKTRLIMKKENVADLIKYHFLNQEKPFRDTAIAIAHELYKSGDDLLARYIMEFISVANIQNPLEKKFESQYLTKINTNNSNFITLPVGIDNDITGMINAIKRNIGINKFLFIGSPGTGKTQVSKYVANLLNRNLFYVNFTNLVDSRLGQTNQNISALFKEINTISHLEKAIILFDEIDVIALDRINIHDLREMGRATSSILRELDLINNTSNKDTIIIATTNLYDNFDKALSRRFDAIINFDQYSKNDLIEIAMRFFISYARKIKLINKDVVLVRKILNLAHNLPYPAELKNIVKTALAFSDINKFEYLNRLYKKVMHDQKLTYDQLLAQGFKNTDLQKIFGDFV